MAAVRKPAATTKTTRTLVLELEDKRRQKITIPANARVTFGCLHPGGKGANGYGDGKQYLRIYEGTSQTAVFANIRSFRDESYPVLVEVVGQTRHEDIMTSDGQVLKGKTEQVLTGRFVPASDDF